MHDSLQKTRSAKMGFRDLWGSWGWGHMLLMVGRLSIIVINRVIHPSIEWFSSFLGLSISSQAKICDDYRGDHLWVKEKYIWVSMSTCNCIGSLLQIFFFTSMSSSFNLLFFQVALTIICSSISYLNILLECAHRISQIEVKKDWSRKGMFVKENNSWFEQNCYWPDIHLN